MTLYEACELADACGLETIGEAIMNVELHGCLNDEELEAFYQNINLYEFDDNEDSIYKILAKGEINNA